MQVAATGVAWYKAENYIRLREMFEDGEKLPLTYAEWHTNAEAGRRTLESQGRKVICVDIDPNAFPIWCRDNGMKPNAQARMKYSSLMAYKVVTGVQDQGGIQ
jgi:formylglycine-generating enzyme required for sulfatase activity